MNKSNQKARLILINTRSKSGLHLQYQISIQFEVMGKVKQPKYPNSIEIAFLLTTANGEYISVNEKIEVSELTLNYSILKERFAEFLSSNGITYQAYMFLNIEDGDKLEMISQTFQMDIPSILDVYGPCLYIIVKSYAVYINDLFSEQITILNDRIQYLEQRLSESENRKEAQLPMALPLLHPSLSSQGAQSQQFKELDIAVLFSEPIFDQDRKRQANYPVDFRSEIQRLHIALNSSYKPQISIMCKIGTKEVLKDVIDARPRILHVICHGSKEGSLQMEDDSKTVLGALQIMKADAIREVLKSLSGILPDLVFINSCYSQKIGQIFFQAGVRHVVTIDSQDKIQDVASQIFGQSFYRNIFKGQKVSFAFKQAQTTVAIKHTSFGCCCRHSAKQIHREDCRWTNIIKKQIGEREGHRLYHIPSQKCVCQGRSRNYHSLVCEWATSTLFQINQKFRIKTQTGQRFPKSKAQMPHYNRNSAGELQLYICCCYNFQEGENGPVLKLPHSQSNKFKLTSRQQQGNTALYSINKSTTGRSQVIDYTSPELLQVHEKVQNSCVMGRQQELYEFMKSIRELSISIYVLYGQPGVGKTSFSIKTATYMFQRRVYELYFFVDLYDIKDKDMFRWKFNEVTKLNYFSGKVHLSELKNKMIVIILDNVDEFCKTNQIDFYKDLNALKSELPKTKFIVTFKSVTYSSVKADKLEFQPRELDVLKDEVAAKLLFSKLRNELDISVEYMDIHGLIVNKPQLKIPKVIQNIVHAFANAKLPKKLKVADLRQKIQKIGQGDQAFYNLIEQNLNNLRERSHQAYEMLIFISQFSQGIDKNDFIIISTYDRPDNKSPVLIPIGRNWKQCFNVLFQKYKGEGQQLTKTVSKEEKKELSPNGSQLILYKVASTIPELSHKPSLIDEPQFHFESTNERRESYFLEELNRNRFIVKRFIRDFIWNKHKSQENFYMKFLFVAYMAVLLDVYIGYLVEEHYIHEDLLENSAVSKMNFFRFRDNNYEPPNMSASMQVAHEINNEFQKLVKSHPTLKQSIKNSDPSVFILHHKLDFLHIYAYDWSHVYSYLKQKYPTVVKTFLLSMQKLIVMIPTALKIANAQNSLIQYAIQKSTSIIVQIRDVLEPVNTLLLMLKVKLMKVNQAELDKNPTIIEDIEQLSANFNKSDINRIKPDVYESISNQWKYQMEFLKMYRELMNTKSKKYGEKTGQSLKQTKERLEEWISRQEEFDSNISCSILISKIRLVLAMIYSNFMAVASKSASFMKFKQSYREMATRFASESGEYFMRLKLIKLALKAKLLAVGMYWEYEGRNQQRQGQKVGRNKSAISRLQDEQANLKECQNIFDNPVNNLAGFTVFDVAIKKLKKQMTQKLWEQSLNSIVFMKSTPLSDLKQPIIQNVVRKKNDFRRQMQSIIKDSHVDVCTKFEVMTIERLQEEAKGTASILLLSVNFRVSLDRIFMKLQGNKLDQVQLELNKQFIEKYPFSKIRLLIIVGQNSHLAGRKLKELLFGPPLILALSSSLIKDIPEEYSQFKQLKQKDLSFSLQHLEEYVLKQAETVRMQMIYIKYLMGKLMETEIVDLHNINWLIQKDYPFLKNTLKATIFQQEACSVIQTKKGTYKDVSPGYRKTHNIDLAKDLPSAIFRKWKQISEVFQELKERKGPKYINIYGALRSGKTTFVDQLARLFVERQLFENGVYVIDGRAVEERFEADFENYMRRMSQTGSILHPQTFFKHANSDFMLIIDDFHVIKPKANGRYQLFLQRLIQKQVSLILVTAERIQKKSPIAIELTQKIQIKSIKVQKMSEFEVNVFALSVLDLENKQIREEYESIRRRKDLDPGTVLKIKEKYMNPRNSMDSLMKHKKSNIDMRKMLSNAS